MAQETTFLEILNNKVKTTFSISSSEVFKYLIYRLRCFLVFYRKHEQHNLPKVSMRSSAERDASRARATVGSTHVTCHPNQSPIYFERVFVEMDSATLY